MLVWNREGEGVTEKSQLRIIFGEGWQILVSEL